MPTSKNYQYKDINYSLKKSERKTTSIYIERDGSISILAPQPYNRNKIEKIIEKKRSWIYKNLAEWEDLNRTRVKREYVNGESFLYLGRNYRLQLVTEQDVPLKFKNGKFHLNISSVSAADEHFKNFYKIKLQKKLADRVAIFSEKMGKEPSSIKIMELKNRWGSCSSKGALNFHWKCAMLPISILDYIVVHEISHIQNSKHSPSFWRSVEKVLPHYDEQKSWLKFNGAGMSL